MTNNPNQHHEESDEETAHKSKEVRKIRKKKTMIDILLYICTSAVIAAGLWLGYLGVSGGMKNNKLLALWITFAGLLFVLTAIFLFITQKIQGQVPNPPNIVFGDSGLREPLAVGHKPWVDIVLNNTSDVPAEGRFSDVTWNIMPSSFRNQLEYAYQGWGIDFDLAPHQILAVHFDNPYPFTQEHIDAVNNGTELLYVYGKGEYWGLNDEGNKMPLPFCFLYDKDTPGNLIICPKGVKIAEGRPGNISEIERPYMHLKRVEPLFLEPGEPIGIEIEYSNAGTRPALNCHLTTTIYPNESLDFIPEQHVQKAKWIKGKGHVVPAGKSHTTVIRTKYPINESQLRAIDRRKKTIFVTGVYSYTDLRGESQTDDFSVWLDAKDGKGAFFDVSDEESTEVWLQMTEKGKRIMAARKKQQEREDNGQNPN